MDTPSSEEKSVLASVGGVVTAILIFVLIWIVGSILFTLFDKIRGVDSWLQALFRELFVPAVGGAMAMGAVNAWIRRASTRFVFFGFSAVLLLLTGAYLGFLVPVSGQGGITWWSLLLGAVSLVAAVVGAYFAVKEEL